jgi:hypothetical protein
MDPLILGLPQSDTVRYINIQRRPGFTIFYAELHVYLPLGETLGFLPLTEFYLGKELLDSEFLHDHGQVHLQGQSHKIFWALVFHWKSSSETIFQILKHFCIWLWTHWNILNLTYSVVSGTTLNKKMFFGRLYFLSFCLKAFGSLAHPWFDFVWLFF